MEAADSKAVPAAAARLVSEKHFSDAISLYESAGRPELSGDETKLITTAYRKLHRFEEEAGTFDRFVKEANLNDPRFYRKQASLLRKSARAFMRVKRWRDAAGIWSRIAVHGKPARGDLLALLCCAHRSDQTETPREIIDRFRDTASELFNPEENAFLSEHVDSPPSLDPGLYILGG